VRDRPQLKVVETGITHERLGICVAKGNTTLRNGNCSPPFGISQGA